MEKKKRAEANEHCSVVTSLGSPSVTIKNYRISFQALFCLKLCTSFGILSAVLGLKPCCIHEWASETQEDTYVEGLYLQSIQMQKAALQTDLLSQSIQNFVLSILGFFAINSFYLIEPEQQELIYRKPCT